LSWSDTYDTQTQTYDRGGRITGTNSFSTFIGGDGFLATNAGSSFTNYIIAFGSPVAYETFSTSSGSTLRGEWNTSQQVTRYYYTYMPDWVPYQFAASFQLPVGWATAVNVIHANRPPAVAPYIYPTLPRAPEISGWFLGAVDRLMPLRGVEAQEPDDGTGVRLAHTAPPIGSGVGGAKWRDRRVSAANRPTTPTTNSRQDRAGQTALRRSWYSESQSASRRTHWSRRSRHETSSASCPRASCPGGNS
jgi:hypothetical protein